MQLICPSCSATIHSDDINLDQLIAKCRQCHAVMNFTLPDEDDEDDDDLDDEEDYDDGPPAQRSDVPMPPEFSLQKTDTELRIIYRWWDPTVFGVVVGFALILGGVLYWLMTSEIGIAKSFRGTFALPVAAMALEAATIYLAFAMVVNRTMVMASADWLTVRQGPLPWRGNRAMTTDQVKQLYCKGEQGTVRYEVHAVTADHGRVKLVGALIEKGMALFIEQQVERFLNIPDRSVSGELRR